jgi:hypothetical protein
MNEQTKHKLLPSQPTREMLIAGVIAVRDSDNDSSEVSNETIVLAMDVLKIAYRAMWIDAPEVDQVQVLKFSNWVNESPYAHPHPKPAVM